MDRKVKADLALMCCSVMWGTTFVLVKIGLDYASPFVYLAARFTIAAALMVLLRPRVIGRIKREEILSGLWLAFYMFASYCFQTAGLQYTTATNSGFISGTSVVLVPLLLGFCWRRSQTKWIYAGSMAALIGLYYLTVPAEGLRHLNRGDVLTFVAAAFAAIYIILVGEYSRKHTVSALSLIQVAGCAVMAWPLMGFAGAVHWQAMRFAWSWPLAVSILICAVFGTAVVFTVQLWAQQYTSPSHAAILLTLIPVFAVITSYLVLHERLRARAWKGAGLVVGGILIAELLGESAAPEAPNPSSRGGFISSCDGGRSEGKGSS